MQKLANESDAHHSIHYFAFSAKFKLLIVASALAMIILVNMLNMPAVMRLVVIIVVTVLAFVYYRAVQDRANEWRFNDRQATVLIRHSWLHRLQSKQSVDRLRHVLTPEESKVVLVTRRSVWQPLFPTLFAGLLMAWLYYFVAVYGTAYSYNTTETIEKRVGPRGNRRIKEVDITTAHTFDLFWLVIIITIVLALAIVVVWLSWFYRFWVLTSLYVYPDLKLPPIYLPFLDVNEEGYTINRIGKADNVTSPVGQLLRFGGVKIILDLGGKEEPHIMDWMPQPRRIVYMIKDAISSAQSTNPSSA